MTFFSWSSPLATHRLAELPTDVLKMIESVTGPVHDVDMASAGHNSEIAARLHLASGTVFVKGLSQDHPRVWTQQREAAINPHTRGLAPALLWQIKEGGWDLLGFEDLGGRHADYSPGSPDLELVLQAMWTLATATPPATVELKTMPQRMNTYVTDPAQLRFFEGHALLHTDWKPDNILIANGQARLVDWAWASSGAAWIDPALWVIWLIASGHNAQEAESLAALHPAWDKTPAPHIDAFARAQQRLWKSIADADQPDEWTHQLHAATHAWAEHRS
ncbi:aminoglycoside phosphotransferase [Streptomyces sp. NPDC002962]|uniref:aminoglycoside phosphotransferase n=1 Tax=Streptomyces sp. NPDC002962 TaxID=3364674 RepID=UPI0036899DC8